MRVLVVGGTGSIGRPVVRELIRGATTSSRSCALPRRPPLDGVIHAAAAFCADDEAMERRFLQKLLPFLSAAPRNTRFIYTGGCWLFGPSGETVGTEDTPFAPLPANRDPPRDGLRT
jgi:nucleoside-diphosphate-sugar epimerase